MANGSAPFLIAEDNALKALMRGLAVPTGDTTSPVGVWFRLPEAEERTVTYPYITIDLVDIAEETDRAHRGLIRAPYVPHGYEPASDGYQIEFPIPVALYYEITTHTRSAWHDRYLQSEILTSRLPFRHGSLTIPTEEAGVNTVRRLDLLGIDQDDGLDINRKREFRKVYSILVSSELFQGEITARVLVETVTLQLSVSDTVFEESV